VNAGPLDADWKERLKEELLSLIAYARALAASGSAWVTLACTKPDGTLWRGRATAFHEGVRFSFDLEVELGPTYPASPPTLRLPALDGKTPKMYPGGALCTDAHFAPLWRRHAPGMGLVSALRLGLAPWLAAELPLLVAAGEVVATADESAAAPPA
jgi:ufm1-conjugating enzyme 1